jgi:DNA-binding winged helix-turn-helix (wHTH) protein/Tol biopolymer transport system component
VAAVLDNSYIMQAHRLPGANVREDFCVDGWLVQPDLNLISRDGTKVRLEPKVMQVFVCLAQRPGEALAKETLLREVWPDTFVTEDVLKRSISELRRALQDDARDPRLIETISKRGYRLVAPIELVSRKDQPGRGAPIRRKSQMIRYGGFALGLLLIGASIAFVRSRTEDPAQVQAVEISQLTDDGQVKSDPLASDGTRIYTSEFWTGRHSVLVQIPLKGGQPVPIVTSLQDQRFFDLSPDGTELLVGSHEDLGRYSLWVLSVTGSVSRQIGELHADDDAAWTPTGGNIVFSHGHEVYLVGSDGKSPRKLFTAPGQVSHIRFSPDAKVIRFTLREMDTKTESLWEVSSAGENAHPLLPGWNSRRSACCGRWTRDGRYYVFQSKDIRTDLWLLPETNTFPWRHDSKTIRLTSGPLEFSWPLPGTVSGTIFAIGALKRSEIMRYDLHSKDYVPYLFGVSAEFVSFSEDAKWFVYSSYPDAILWRARMDGTQKAQLTFPPMRAYAPRWSPDGSRIAFMGNLPGKSPNVYAVSADGHGLEQILPEERDQADPNWSSDGNSIMFGGMDTQCAPIRTVELRNKHTSTVPGSEKLFSPRWSPNGRYVIAATCERPYRLMLFDFQTSAWKELFSRDASYPTWSHDGKYVYFRSFQSIARVRISDRKAENLVDLASMKRLPVGTFGYWFGLAPDDSPLLSRDISTHEVYSIRWQAR